MISGTRVALPIGAVVTIALAIAGWTGKGFWERVDDRMDYLDRRISGFEVVTKEAYDTAHRADLKVDKLSESVRALWRVRGRENE